MRRQRYACLQRGDAALLWETALSSGTTESARAFISFHRPTYVSIRRPAAVAGPLGVASMRRMASSLRIDQPGQHLFLCSDQTVAKCCSKVGVRTHGRVSCIDVLLRSLLPKEGSMEPRAEKEIAFVMGRKPVVRARGGNER